MKILLLLGILLTPLAVWSENTDQDWEKLGVHDGITSYKKDIPGSPIVAFKADALVDAPIAKVAGTINDAKRAPEWVERLINNQILHTVSPHEWIEYRHIGTPPILKDREFVMKVTTEWDKKNQTWYMHFVSVDDPDAPKTSYVRGTLMNTSFKLQPAENGTKTYMQVEVHADPKGSVPKWVVNLFQRSWAPNTIKAIRKQVLKSDVTELKDMGSGS